jgi:ribose 5-phosphate isomerase RpiB
MLIGIASDHGGLALKGEIAATPRACGQDIRDFGAVTLKPSDDYPDFVVPLARAVAAARRGAPRKLLRRRVNRRVSNFRGCKASSWGR